MDTFFDIFPDIAVFLLAIAGLGYLMPSFLHKVEGSKWLRRGIAAFVVIVAGTAITINYRMRAKQTQQQSQTSDDIKAVKAQNEQILARLTASSSSNTATATKGNTPLPLPSNDDQRRRDILSALKSEYIVTHLGQLPAQVVNDPSWNPPADWINRRLYELHEKWAIGIPFSISSLSNEKLRNRVFVVTKNLREMQQEYATRRSENNQKWWEASVHAHADLKDFSHDSERHNQELEEMMKLTTQMATDWENKFRVDVGNLWNELRRRISGVSLTPSDATAAQALSTLDHNSLAGPAPLADVAAYLDGLAKQLPND